MVNRRFWLIAAIIGLLAVPVGGAAQGDDRPPLTDRETAVISRENFGQVELLESTVGQTSLTAAAVAWGAGQQFAITNTTGFAIFDTPTAEPIEIAVPTAVQQMVFSPNGAFLLVRADGIYWRYRADDWTARPDSFRPAANMSQLTLRDDGSIAVTISYDGEPGQCRRAIVGGPSLTVVEQTRLYWYGSYCAIVPANPDWLVSAGTTVGGAVRYPSSIINVVTGEQYDATPLANASGLPLISPDMRYWLFNSNRGVRGEPFMLYEFVEGTGFRLVNDGFGVYGEDRQFNSVLFSPDSTQLITASDGYFGYRIHIFDLSRATASGVPVIQNDPNYQNVNPRGLYFNRDFSATFLYTSDGFQIWDWPGRNVVWELPEATNFRITGRVPLMFSLDNRAVLAGAVSYGREDVVRPEGIASGPAFFTPDGETFYNNGNLYTVAGRELERSFTYNLGSNPRVGYSTDGSAFWIVAGNEQAGFALQVWRHNAFELLFERAVFGSEATLEGYLLAPRATSILAQRRLRDRTNTELLLMNIATGEEYSLFLPAGFTATNYRYTADGRYVILYTHRLLLPEETVSGNADFPIREWTYSSAHEFAIWDTQQVFATGSTQPTHRVVIPLSETVQVSPTSRERRTYLPEIPGQDVYVIEESDTLLLRLNNASSEMWFVMTYSEFLTENRPTYDMVTFPDVKFTNVVFSHDGRLMAITTANVTTPQMWGVPTD